MDHEWTNIELIAMAIAGVAFAALRFFDFYRHHRGIVKQARKDNTPSG